MEVSQQERQQPVRHQSQRPQTSLHPHTSNPTTKVNSEPAILQKGANNVSQQALKPMIINQQNIQNEPVQKSKSAHGQRKTVKRQAIISQFDKLEEARYKSYETGETLLQLIDLINRSHSKVNENTSFITLSNESWSEIKKLANQASELYSSSIVDWDSIIDHLTSDVNEYKSVCHRMKSKLNITRKDRLDQSKYHENSLKNIASAYNKNRTQLFTVMDEMELAIHDMKHGIEKRNVKQMGYMTQLERDMDDCMNDVVTNSGNVIINTLNNSNSRNGMIGSPRYISGSESHIGKPAEVITPRTQQQQLSQRRGRSQQPQQKETSRLDVLPPQYPINNPGESKKMVNIPLLPIHMITQSNNHGIPPTGLHSHRNMNIVQSQSQLSNRQLSSRRQQNLPPHHQQPGQLSARGSNISQRSNKVASGRASTRDSQRSIAGAIVDGYLLNPVFLGAVYQTSRFDKNLEDDYEGADQTLPFETDRLRQYSDEYQMLMDVDDEEKKILVKQWLFMIHEKELKNQAKQEKAARVAQRRALRHEQQQLNNNYQFDGTTPRGRSNPAHNENDSTIKDPSVADNQGHRSSDSKGNNNSPSDSILSLQRQLPMLCTLELISARRKEMFEEVQLDQLLDVQNEIHDLIKTATQKSIIFQIEKEYQMKEQLMKDDRKILEWSSQDDNSRIENEEISTPHHSSFATDAIEHKNSINTSSQGSKNQHMKPVVNIANAPILVHLEAVAIISNGRSNSRKQVDDHKSKKQLVIQLSPIVAPAQNSENSSNSGAISLINTSPVERPDNQYYYDREVYPNNECDQYSLIQQQIADQLEIIQERQSELSSSINTNNRQLSRLSTHRNQKQAVNGSSRMGGLLSARESTTSNAYSNNINVVDFNKLQILLPQQQRPIVRNNNYIGIQNELIMQQQQETSEIREEKYKRCKSHRQSLQSAPISQRDEKPSYRHQQKQIDLFYDHQSVQNGNFQSIQDDDDSFINQKYGAARQKRQQQNEVRRPVTDLGMHNNASFSSSGGQIIFDNKRCKGDELFARRYSPMINDPILCPQHFSSIQNQFEESKTSDFKNESLFIDENSMLFKQSPKAISDLGGGYRENDELCDFDEIELNQMHQQLYNKFVPLPGYIPLSSYLRDTSINPDISTMTKLGDQKQNLQNKSLLPGSSLSLRHHHFLYNNNINSSQLLLGNQSNQSAIFPTNTQQHNQSNLLIQSRRGLTANMMSDFLRKNFTQQKLEGPTSKSKPQNQIHGQSGFTLSSLGDETLMYMFPAQKTQRRTLFMLQNFHNNYYNNQAGVLFTMPISTGDINNGSTLPSAADPDLCSGGMTQSQTKHMSKHMRHHHNHQHQSQTANLMHKGTAQDLLHHQHRHEQDSFLIKEDSNNILHGLQRYCMPNFYNNDHSKQLTAGLSKNHNVAALSTGESGTFKSTGLGGLQNRFNNPNIAHAAQSINQSQTHGGAEMTLSPRISFDINETTKQALQASNQSDFKVSGNFRKVTKGKNNRASSQNPILALTSESGAIQNKKTGSNKNMMHVVQSLHNNSSQHKLVTQLSASRGLSSTPQQQKHISSMLNRNIKIVHGNTSSSGLARLQAIAGSAHSSAVQSGATRGHHLIIKKPNLQRILKGHPAPIVEFI